MNPEHAPITDDPARFCTTRWSAILVAAQSQLPGSQAALSELCRLYWYPLYAFARRRGSAPHDAQDLTQGFFLHLLEHRALKHVQPLKGKFRSFLLASFQNFLADEIDRARCLKRGGNREFVFLDAEDGEKRYGLEPRDHLTAEKIFEARWAMTLLTRAVERLRDDYVARGEQSKFEVLKVFVGVEEGKGPPSYEEIAKLLGVRIGAAKTLIHRFRKQYAAFLRQEVALTVTDPAEIEDEIRALCDALVVAEGRL
ncbi:MAG: sigma-70 family RNA polymerase sigma factor [Verrucomicrobia bacterium]|nr:sigma-70 family RNA polymerase sigma factor [Verrucomicrobiota bacterium]